jgi:hypothetical protein
MSTPAAAAYAAAQQPAPTHTPLGQRELTHADRCDQCGAAAYARVESYETTLQLMFCGHHFTALEKYFPADLYEILDERKHLRAAVKAQANYANGVG